MIAAGSTGAALKGGLEIIGKVHAGANPQVLAETQKVFRIEKSPLENNAKQIEFRNSGIDWKAKLNEKLKASEVEIEQAKTTQASVKLSDGIEIKNTRFGTTEEKQIATLKIKAYREQVGEIETGNYGYIEGKFGQIKLEGKIIRSDAPDALPQVFETLKVNSRQQVNGEGSWLRTTDSEYKMLNTLANRIGAKKGEIHPEITGELKIVSERKFCPSCNYVIQQFQQMFPNVKLILVEKLR